jgi:hypothetical protein
MDLLNKILGINWKTTITGIGVIVAAGGRMLMAFRTKNYDFVLLAEDGQLIMTTLGLLLTGVGLLKAKDENVTGTGDGALTSDSSGALKNREGIVVVEAPPQPKEDQ